MCEIDRDFINSVICIGNYDEMYEELRNIELKREYGEDRHLAQDNAGCVIIVGVEISKGKGKY